MSRNNSRKRNSRQKSEERSADKYKDMDFGNKIPNTITSQSDYYGSPMKRNRGRNSNKSTLSFYKHVMRVSRVNGSFGKRRNFRNKGRIRVNTHNPARLPANDFDIDGLDQDLPTIDLMIDYLEKEMPKDDYLDSYGFNMEEMMMHNMKLRDKITDMIKLCKDAILRASNLKKTIITHRTIPQDPELRDKREELKNFQKQNLIAQKYIKGLSQKAMSMEENKKVVSYTNKIQKLNKEVIKLESHKKKLVDSLYNQWKDLTSLNPSSEINSKISKAASKIADYKQANLAAQNELKDLELLHKSIRNEYTKLSKHKNALINKKIALRNNIPQREFDKKSFALQEEYETQKNKHENFKTLMIDRGIKQIDKIFAKEKQCASLEEKILEVKARLVKETERSRRNYEVVRRKRERVKEVRKEGGGKRSGGIGVLEKEEIGIFDCKEVNFKQV
ncbi:unnamed protein product [Moneuplotes crassus]|uniref:Uncharacterized protein n=1 Tax=Euplotes crassus TaxID=5936 RepID=A0AAD1UER7_EUPCR|nr:unnamed protein product [Moneuplotes crassus]